MDKTTLKFKGSGKEFFGIWIVNILLSIVTLGIYSAWAKVRTKRYFYGNTFIGNDSFEYHAKPMQILRGRIVAFVAVIIWSVSNTFFPVVSLVLLLAFVAIVPWLLWSNARFDAFMTSYRNVRFSFNASVKQAYMTILGRGLGACLIIAIYFAITGAVASVSFVAMAVLAALSVVMFILVYAWVIAGMHQYFVNGYQYGDWRFSSEITTKFFVSTYLKALAVGVVVSLVVSVITFLSVFGGFDLDLIQSGMGQEMLDNSLGAVFFGYAVMFALMLSLTAYTATKVRNYVFSQLSLHHEQAAESTFTFESHLTVKSYLWLIISNFLLQAVTIGLARPWVMTRTSNYLAERTVVVGNLDDLISIGQASDINSAVTDELAEAFDLGLGIS